MSTTVERSVVERYGAAAKAREAELCCPVTYDPQYLRILPPEIIERDYGCGDPSAFAREGDTVLDLGSGGGKICFITAQIVGPTGRVIGIDMNEDMLMLANKYRAAVGDRLGYHNVEFRKGRIQDLALDLAVAEDRLRKRPLRTLADVADFEAFTTALRSTRPLVADESVDLILSNCVLNLVRPEDKDRLFTEMFRVVRRGGRIAISDIVSDETVPPELQSDPTLWSGCISGAFREDAFLAAFERAGFYGMEVVKREDAPWRTVQGIEFRSMTVVAHKGKQGPCWERRQAVIYRGPWKQVMDDDGHVFQRGQRVAVCDKTFGILSREPYAASTLPVPPLVDVPIEAASPFDCARAATRDPKETKGEDYTTTTTTTDPCHTPGGACC
ncbi:MAG: methyltransferase domain-containing protein [Gemmatimonadaceae bacterium]